MGRSRAAGWVSEHSKKGLVDHLVSCPTLLSGPRRPPEPAHLTWVKWRAQKRVKCVG
jgi:hypothetical protein